MTIGEDLLVFLSGYQKGYALMRKRMRGYTGPARPVKLSTETAIKNNTLRVTLSRLKKQGLVSNKNFIWSITPKGKFYIKEKVGKFLSEHLINIRLSRLTYKRKGGGDKNMIIAFDIPESRKKVRNWLRIELLNLGFSQLQKSVWFGPAPLPSEFIEYISKLGILSNIKFFKATKYGIT